MSPPIGAKISETTPSTLEALVFKGERWNWSRPYIMGILNVTPDSFSDGGLYFQPGQSGIEKTVAAGLRLADQGASCIDVGGESTRPGAAAVSEAEECQRVIPVIAKLASTLTIPISVDTTKAAVASAALDAGAEIVNDVSGGRFDSEMISLVNARCPVFVAGHVRGRSLKEAHAAASPSSSELIDEMRASLKGLEEKARTRTVVDPCLGFGKNRDTNLHLLSMGSELRDSLGLAVLLGPSRKRFIGEVTGLPLEGRDSAPATACVLGYQQGAHIFRVHDVEGTRSALNLASAVGAAKRGRAGV